MEESMESEGKCIGSVGCDAMLLPLFPLTEDMGRNVVWTLGARDIYTNVCFCRYEMPPFLGWFPPVQLAIPKSRESNDQDP